MEFDSVVGPTCQLYNWYHLYTLNPRYDWKFSKVNIRDTWESQDSNDIRDTKYTKDTNYIIDIIEISDTKDTYHRYYANQGYQV